MSFHVIKIILNLLDTFVITLGLLRFCTFVEPEPKVQRRSNMDKFIRVINNLVTKAEVRVLERAARILIASDKHDAVFFAACQSMQGAGSNTNTVRLGDSYVLCRTQAPVTQKVVEVIEHDS